MTLFERVVLIIGGVGILLKVLHIPVHPMFPPLTISLLLLMFYYLVFGFAVLNGIQLKDVFRKNAFSMVSKQRVLGTIFIGWGIGMLILGLLLNILTVSSPLRSFSLIYLSFCLFFFIILVKEKKDLYRRVVVRISIPLFFGYVSIFYPISNYLDEEGYILFPKIFNIY